MLSRARKIGQHSHSPKGGAFTCSNIGHIIVPGQHGHFLTSNFFDGDPCHVHHDPPAISANETLEKICS